MSVYCKCSHAQSSHLEEEPRGCIRPGCACTVFRPKGETEPTRPSFKNAAGVDLFDPNSMGQAIALMPQSNRDAILRRIATERKPRR